MAGVPLLQEGPEKSNRSVRSSISRFTNFLSSAIAGKDELTVACEKAASTHTSSYSPKEKHLQYIIEQVDENPSLIEEVLLRFSALTNWAEDAVVAIKVLSCIHQIVRRVPNCLVIRSDAFIVFLDEIRNHWSAQQVVFVDQYSAALLHLVLTARQHYQLYENTFTRGIGVVSVGISFFQADEIVVYISKLLSFQERLSALIRIPSFPTSMSQKNPGLARRAACTVIVEQCKLLLSVIRYLILHVENLKDQEPVETGIFRDQMDYQEKFLQSVEREFL